MFEILLTLGYDHTLTNPIIQLVANKIYWHKPQFITAISSYWIKILIKQNLYQIVFTFRKMEIVCAFATGAPETRPRNQLYFMWNCLYNYMCVLKYVGNIDLVDINVDKKFDDCIA